MVTQLNFSAHWQLVKLVLVKVLFIAEQLSWQTGSIQKKPWMQIQEPEVAGWLLVLEIFEQFRIQFDPFQE